nr:methyl-accepting chemotaxis protein [Texcoconibacillus texcoconensis]
MYKGFTDQSSLREHNAERESDLISNAVNNTITNQFRQIEIGIAAIEENEDIINAFADRDRDRLNDLTLPIMENLSDHGIEQFQFHLPNGTSFFRAHQPEDYGDDLTSFRQTVVEANQREEVITALEGGVAGAGFRHVIPISHDNSHIGTVEIGLGLHKGILDQLKTNYDGEWFFYGIEDDQARYLLGTEEESPVSITNPMMEDINQNKMISENIDSHQVNIIPLKDFNEDVKWYIQRVEDQTEQIAQVNRQNLNNFLLGTFISMIGIGFIIILLRSFLKPLTDMSNHFEQIANGDLSVPSLTVKNKDEIGTLAISVNKMVESIRDLIGSANTISEQTAASSEELSSSSTQIKDSIEQVSSTTEELATGATSQAEETNNALVFIQTINEDIQNINANLKQLDHHSTNGLQTSNKGIESSSKAKEQMNLIESKVSETSNEIMILSEKSKEISSILNVIEGISDQTNLLALNASIEAARAGEHGKGFAVVAEEVRKLAEQTGNEIDQISSIISAIQTEVSQSGQSMKEVVNQVQTGGKVIDENVDSFKEIDQVVREMTETVGQVSSAATQITERIAESVSAIENIASITEESSAASEQLSATMEEQNVSMQEINSMAEGLAKYAEDLNESLSQFKLHK